MAEKSKKVEGSKFSGERIFTIPLRSEWLREPRNRRAKRAVSGVKNFLIKHTKAESVWVSEAVNRTLWSSGSQKPPSRIKVKVKIDDGIAKARLPDEVEIVKKEEKKSRLDKLKDVAESKTGVKLPDVKEKRETPKEKSALDQKLEGHPEEPAEKGSNVSSEAANGKVKKDSEGKAEK